MNSPKVMSGMLCPLPAGVRMLVVVGQVGPEDRFHWRSTPVLGLRYEVRRHVDGDQESWVDACYFDGECFEFTVGYGDWHPETNTISECVMPEWPAEQDGNMLADLAGALEVQLREHMKRQRQPKPA